jgi:enediyne biosynthesis thioesterase
MSSDFFTCPYYGRLRQKVKPAAREIQSEDLMSTSSFEIRHVVGFEETNLTGNVYYVNHLRWQGRCRELFLRRHCPSILEDLAGGLALVTTRCGCEYFDELLPFDEVAVRMRLGEIVQNRVTMLFEYVRLTDDGAEQLVARGEQQIACMRRDGARTLPTAVPAALREALEPFAAD